MHSPQIHFAFLPDEDVNEAIRASTSLRDFKTLCEKKGYRVTKVKARTDLVEYKWDLFQSMVLKSPLFQDLVPNSLGIYRCYPPEEGEIKIILQPL